MSIAFEKLGASDPALLAGLRELFDHHQLTQLLNGYVHAADDGRWEDWAALFAENAAVEMPQGAHVGRAGLAQWASDSLSAYQHMMHFSGNHDIRVSGDAATSRSKVVAVCVPDAAERENHLTWGGVYSIRFVREQGGWKIAALQFELVWSEGAGAVAGPKGPKQGER
jgi:hypothetical protein